MFTNRDSQLINHPPHQRGVDKMEVITYHYALPTSPLAFSCHCFCRTAFTSDKLSQSGRVLLVGTGLYSVFASQESSNNGPKCSNELNSWASRTGQKVSGEKPIEEPCDPAQSLGFRILNFEQRCADGAVSGEDVDFVGMSRPWGHRRSPRVVD